MPDELDRLRGTLLGRLESLAGAGVLQLPKRASRHRESSPEAAVPETAQPAIGIPVSEGAEVGKMARSTVWSRSGIGALFETTDTAAPTISDAASLPVLKEEVAACTRCSELAAKRTQTVFGVGNPQARLCFLGEAPGADEDRLGEPFVGRAGQLLNKIIEACRLKREDVYILNMIKCRPPGNRNPLPSELANCPASSSDNSS